MRTYQRTDGPLRNLASVYILAAAEAAAKEEVYETRMKGLATAAAGQSQSDHGRCTNYTCRVFSRVVFEENKDKFEFDCA